MNPGLYIASPQLLLCLDRRPLHCRGGAGKARDLRGDIWLRGTRRGGGRPGPRCTRDPELLGSTWERAESRSVTQETEREINKHMGAGVVTFQEGSKRGGKSLWERQWGLRGWSRWEEAGPWVSFLVLGIGGHISGTGERKDRVLRGTN